MKYPLGNLFSRLNTFLRLFLCVALLAEQLLLGAAPAFGQIRPYSISKAPADNTSVNQLEKELQQQIAARQGLKMQIASLEAQARAALEKNDRAEFARLQKEINAKLFILLNSSLNKDRIYALEMIAARIREGLINEDESTRIFALLHKWLAHTASCSGEKCQALGLAALVLALSVTPATGVNVSPEYYLSLASVDAARRQDLLQLYFQTFNRNYGSVEANNEVGRHVVYALAYVGAERALQQALEKLIDNSRRMPVLWQQASVPSGDWYLNRYDVHNMPVQKALFEALASLGEGGKKVVQYYAKENRGLTSFVRANITLAYMGPTEINVKENLYHLYCDRNFQLSAQDDFELKKEIAYAYGQGRAPAYLQASGSNQCRVIVPQKPNPYLLNQELTQRIMGEVLFNAALMGSGEFFNILLKTRQLKLALKAGKAARSPGGKALPSAAIDLAKQEKPLPALSAKAAEVGKQERTLPALSQTLSKSTPAQSSIAHPYNNARYIDQSGIPGSLEWEKERLLVQIDDAKSLQSLNIAQRSHLNYLEKKLAEEPPTVLGIKQIRNDFSSLTQRKENAFVVFGPQMDSYTFLEEEMSSNFLTGTFGRMWNGKENVYGQSLGELLDQFMAYGKTSEHIFIRWNAHGNALNNTGKWVSWLGPDTYVNMESLATTLQLVMQTGPTRTVTLFLDSCFPGAAFDDFLRLPKELKKNINLFATGGRLELNYSFPSSFTYSNANPLSYARKIWEEKIVYQGGTGRAYIDGRIIRPLDEAINYNRRMGTAFTPALEAIKSVADATTPKELSQAISLLQETNISVFNKTTVLPSYIFLIPNKGRIVNHAGYEIYLPSFLTQQIFKGLDQIPF